MSGSNKDSENEARVGVGCSGQGFTGRLLVCAEQPEWSEGETNRSVSKKKACAACRVGSAALPSGGGLRQAPRLRKEAALGAQFSSRGLQLK